MLRNKKKLSIYTELSKKYGLPYSVIELICNHPFKFAKDRISDPDDWKSLMFSYLFKIKPKRKVLEEHEISKE
jgi:hypothetical protein